MAAPVAADVGCSSTKPRGRPQGRIGKAHGAVEAASASDILTQRSRSRQMPGRKGERLVCGARRSSTQFPGPA